ncbi:hypothetical protein N9424_00750 [Gammaproteobacteria bacterium]|nr:hypothetical protein [Gammaproteobacteria bacterium]
MKILFLTVFILVTQLTIADDYTYLKCEDKKVSIKKLLSGNLKINEKKIRAYSNIQINNPSNESYHPKYQKIHFYLLKVSKENLLNKKEICSEYLGLNESVPAFYPGFRNRGEIEGKKICSMWDISDSHYTREKWNNGYSPEGKWNSIIMEITLNREKLMIKDENTPPSSLLPNGSSNYARCSVSNIEEHKLIKKEYKKIAEAFYKEASKKKEDYQRALEKKNKI